MPRKNSKGYCDERSIDVQELSLCDYYCGKRKNGKLCCKNCTHFHLLETCKKGNNIDRVPNDD